jgi:dihydroflavonol-4-reductase
MMNHPHILVTGATGFIGRFLTLELLKRGESVAVLLRNPQQQLRELHTWLSTRGADTTKLSAIQGDLSQPQAGITDWQILHQITVLYHTGALFAWGLSSFQARRVNVLGSIELLHALKTHTTLQRVMGVSGYMLTMTDHLKQAGINISMPMQTDWPKVYKRLGAYEASKIEAHYQLITTCQSLGLDWTIVHPATVIGHSQTGEILQHQQFAQLLRQLKQGKLSAIPATSAHRLPLVSIDDVVTMMIAASQDPQTIDQEYLLADRDTPNLATVLTWAGEAMNVQVPTRYVSIRILRLLLCWRWLAKKLDMSSEMLSFLRTEPLNTLKTDQLRQCLGLTQPNLQHTVKRTAAGMKCNTDL